MNTKFTPHRYFWIVFVAILVACGTPPAEGVTGTLLTTVPTFTSVTQTQTALQSATPQQLFPLENLRMAYVIDGKLYVQNGSAPAIYLTQSGDGRIFDFSDDAEKIVFYRQGTNVDDNGIHSINADGSQQQVLITKKWLDSLGVGTNTLNGTFVPGTHNWLFNTYFCPQKQENETCVIGLFLVNTDTGGIKEFVKPQSVGNMFPLGNGNFSVSPDGKLISVAMSGHIDIFNVDGEIMYSSITTYILSAPMELVPMQHWLPGSDGLILTIPNEVHAGSAFPNSQYSVWRYTLGGQAMQIPLDSQQPVWTTSGCSDATSISPDGNWFLYTREPSLYLGNLQTGHTQIYASGCSNTVFWSPDSKQFLFEDKSLNFFIGSVDRLPIPIVRFPSFVGWIDASHYITLLRSINANEKSKILVTETTEETLLIYETGIYLPENIDSFDGFLMEKADK